MALVRLCSCRLLLGNPEWKAWSVPLVRWLVKLHRLRGRLVVVVSGVLQNGVFRGASSSGLRRAGWAARDIEKLGRPSGFQWTEKKFTRNSNLQKASDNCFF